ncbi:hypothetical protein GCM10009785_13910 [Brooklawnia cerclae]|uniref:Helix-turn-helix domain-containing protein n=1 Tax=Brooklawnia cerclae TaxID=349934 RepID=A0ABX0SI04_9ACTN|nr:helix-turn-helix domain-containing protein [Brooklawnia cerclae]NIH58040.1 hypothetical protein [Brooklawnia cerclae]
MPTPLEFAGNAAGYLTPREATAYMPRHEKTIRDMCAGREITCLRLGSDKKARYYIHRSVIRAWLDAHTDRALTSH